jgi:hypothetical protein
MARPVGPKAVTVGITKRRSRPDDCRLPARQPRQAVDAADHAGVDVVPQRAVIGEPVDVAVERVEGSMGEHEGVLDAEIHAARSDRRVNMRGIARQHHAADLFARGDAVEDVERRLPAKLADPGAPRQMR